MHNFCPSSQLGGYFLNLAYRLQVIDNDPKLLLYIVAFTVYYVQHHEIKRYA